MSPRRRPSQVPPGKKGKSGGPAPSISLERIDVKQGVEYFVRPMRGAAEPGFYRCPGCDQELPKSQPHLVVWPREPMIGEAVEGRRHWHTPCWTRSR